MNAVEGLDAVGAVFLVRWALGKTMSEWKTPDGSLRLDHLSVERMTREHHGTFVAWRVASELKGSGGASVAEPVVWRRFESMALGAVPLRQFEIETNVAGAGWAPRGNVLAADSREALTVAMLAGLTFVREPHARAKHVPPALPSVNADAVKRLEVTGPAADE